jgi:hypothetical protein
MSVPCRPDTPAYMPQAKTKGQACAHALPHATTALEPASLLREGSSTTTCPKALDLTPLHRRGPVLPHVPRLRTLHLRIGGVWHYHVFQGSRPCTFTWEGSGAAICPKAPDPAPPSRRGPVLPRVPWPPRAMGHRDKERLSCNGMQQGSLFPRHAHMLPRRLQDVRADDIIMTCKPCRQA